jgi:predicted MFS family arabinose efflux permease
VEPEVVIAQAALIVPGRPIDIGWEGLGSRFARYLAGAGLSLYGDWLTTVALVVLLFHLSGPAAPAGYMLARVLPRLVSGGLGGALADRFQPQHVVAGSAVVQGLFTLSIIPSARIGAVWAVYGAVAFGQFAGGLARPALGALVPRVAPPQRLQRANALYSLAFSSSIAVGPALATPLLTAFGTDALLLIDVATFAVAAVLMLTLRVSRRGAWASGPQRLAVGLTAVWHDPTLRTMAAGFLCSAIAVTAASSVLVLIARTVGGTSLVGYLYAAVGGGSVIVGLLVLRFRPRLASRDVLVAFALLEVLCLAVLTLHGPFWAAVIPLAISGGAGVVWQTWGTTDMQMRVHAAFLGRVNGVMVVAASTGMLIGAVLALALVPWAGWERTLFVACCLSLVVLLAGVVLGPQRSPAAD